MEHSVPGSFVLGDVPKLLWVLLNGMVFAVHEDQLRRTSRFFDTMLDLPTGDRTEGASSDCPLRLDDHATPEQWGAYWKYIYRPHYSQRPEIPDQQYWRNLLAVGEKFEVDAAIGDAKTALQFGGPFQLSAAEILHLGRLYLYDDWVAAAAIRLADTPILALELNEYSLLGDRTVALLVELQFKLIQHRANLATTLPGQLKSHSFSCIQEKSCQSAWFNVCHRLSRLLLRPSHPLSELKLLSVIRSREGEATALTKMSMDCARSVITLCESSLTGRDDALVNQIVQRVTAANLPGQATVTEA